MLILRNAIASLALLATSLTLAGAQRVDEVKLRAAGGDKVRPLESVVIEVAVNGQDEKGASKVTGRLQMTATVQIKGGNGSGWLSKPFSCADSERQLGRYVSADNGTLASILGLVSDFTIKDCILYTAPQQPGRYEIEASAEGKTGKLTIQVDPGADARTKPETVNFASERQGQDPYRALAEHYAPFIAQETWFSPKADYATRFDYDNDWDGNNNWENLEIGTSQAYVYYAAMETNTHWFLIYNVFHPRDYSDRCVVGTCHENDNEGLILTIRKDGSPFGQLQLMETLAHNNVYSFIADDRIRPAVHDIDGRLDLYDGSHPVIFIESGGHGIYGVTSSHARYDFKGDKFLAGTGVTYRYKGSAERPRDPDDRLVGYELLPILDQWWSKANRESGWNQATFDDYYVYQPLGGRPGVPYSMIGGAFLGRREAENKAKPFWGWHDERTRKRNVLATGQWGLDPAYAVSRNLSLPAADAFSLDYIYNPYLGIGSPPPVNELAQLDRTPGVDRRSAPASPGWGNAQPASGSAGAWGGTPPAAQNGAEEWNFPSSNGTPVATSPAPPVGGADAWPLEGTDLPGTLLSSPDNNPFQYNFDRNGSLTFRGRVDGEIRLHIRGDYVSVERVSGRPVEVESLRFTQPLPSEPAAVTVQKQQGRGSVAILTQPDATNGYTAVISVSDSSGGDDLYRFVLSWKR